jgi:hypothetical protein
MIAAIEKADSLHRFAVSQGAHLSTFVVVLSDQDALELLDWFVEQYEFNSLLEMDVAEAKAKHDPWNVLSNFTLHGMSIAPLSALN